MRDLLIAMPRGQGIVLAGSKPYDCTSCGVELLVAPTGQKRIKEMGLAPTCPECALAQAKADPNPQFQPMEPDQLAEVEGHLRRN